MSDALADAPKGAHPAEAARPDDEQVTVAGRVEQSVDRLTFVDV